MRKLYAGVVVLGLLALVGCSSSPTGGGSEAGGTFKIKGAPATTTEIKHGDSKTFDLTVDKDKGFKEDITFSAKVEPEDKKGVKAEVDPKTWKASDPPDVHVKVTVSDDAPAGDYTVNVTATPSKGNPTPVSIKIKVPEKK